MFNQRAIYHAIDRVYHNTLLTCDYFSDVQRPRWRRAGLLARAQAAEAIGVDGRASRRRHGAFARPIVSATRICIGYHLVDHVSERHCVSVLAAVAELEYVGARPHDGRRV